MHPSAPNGATLGHGLKVCKLRNCCLMRLKSYASCFPEEATIFELEESHDLELLMQNFPKRQLGFGLNWTERTSCRCLEVIPKKWYPVVKDIISFKYTNAVYLDEKRLLFNGQIGNIKAVTSDEKAFSECSYYKRLLSSDLTSVGQTHDLRNPTCASQCCKAQIYTQFQLDKLDWYITHQVIMMLSRVVFR